MCPLFKKGQKLHIKKTRVLPSKNKADATLKIAFLSTSAKNVVLVTMEPLNVVVSGSRKRIAKNLGVVDLVIK